MRDGASPEHDRNVELPVRRPRPANADVLVRATQNRVPGPLRTHQHVHQELRRQELLPVGVQRLTDDERVRELQPGQFPSDKTEVAGSEHVAVRLDVLQRSRRQERHPRHAGVTTSVTDQVVQVGDLRRVRALILRRCRSVRGSRKQERRHGYSDSNNCGHQLCANGLVHVSHRLCFDLSLQAMRTLSEFCNAGSVTAAIGDSGGLAGCGFECTRNRTMPDTMAA